MLKNGRMSGESKHLVFTLSRRLAEARHKVSSIRLGVSVLLSHLERDEKRKSARGLLRRAPSIYTCQPSHHALKLNLSTQVW